MKLTEATKLINKIFKQKPPEEDCEGLSSAMLAPNASVTGGDISNSDSFATGDTRMPKSLFNKIQKRKKFEEDEEYVEPDFEQLAIQRTFNLLSDEDKQQIEDMVDQGKGTYNDLLMQLHNDIYANEYNVVADEEAQRFFDYIRSW